MSGVSISIVQPNGVTTIWATILNVYWQIGLAANVQIGYYLTETGYVPGAIPVYTQYWPINIALIDPTQAIPPQLAAQLLAPGAPLYGGTPTS